jgi:methylamine dehydrogenase accessory protein MauD
MIETLLTSQALLWLVVVIQAVALIALARQVGVLYERVAPAGALAVNQTLRSGDAVPEMNLESLTGRVLKIGGQPERMQLLFFLSPSCPVCKSLLPALRSLQRDQRSRLEVLLASDGERAVHERFVDREGLGDFQYLLSEQLGRQFGVAKLPYAVLINSDGTVASYGIVNSREHLESLLEAQELGVSSIQDYMTRAQGSGPIQVKPEQSSKEVAHEAV